MNIVDKTTGVARYVKACPYRKAERIKRIIVHRFGPKENGVQILHAEDAAAFFGQNPEYTGGKMAYHFLILEDGTIERALHDEEVGQHTKGFNQESVAIAVLGDFRFSKPTVHQNAALIELCADYCRRCNISPALVVGHDECPGGSADPNKICPGKNLSMKRLREDVALELTNAVRA